MNDQTAQMEMPRYKCHKEVWALKIADIRYVGEHEHLITPEDKKYAPFQVESTYVDKHDPKPGGYYVAYKGGYKSYSPAEAFEGGYSLVD